MSLMSNIGEWLRPMFFAYLERHLGKQAIDRAEVEPETIENILVLPESETVEELLMAIPVVRAIRRRYPDCGLAVAVDEEHGALLQNISKRVYPYPAQGFLCILRLARLTIQIRGKFELAVILNVNRHRLRSDVIAHFSGAKYVLGSDANRLPGTERNFICNLLAEAAEPHEHQVERNLKIVRHLGIDTENLSAPLSLTVEEVKEASSFLTEEGVNTGGRVFAIEIEGEDPENRLLVQEYVSLAKHFSMILDSRILLVWQPEVEEIAMEVHAGLPFKPLSARDLRPRQLAALLLHCDVLVGNDSRTMHLAASVGTPLVALFWTKNPDEWKPVGPEFVAINLSEGEPPANLTAEIIEHVNKLVAKYPKSARTDFFNMDISDEALESCIKSLTSVKQ